MWFISGLIGLFALVFPSTLSAQASGDAGAGAREYRRQCAACHVVRSPVGQTFAGARARTGPNLYGSAGGAIAAARDFRYADGLTLAGRQGLVWTEENFVAYLNNPGGWLQEATGNPGVRSRMLYRVSDETAAADIYAYLASLGG